MPQTYDDLIQGAEAAVAAGAHEEARALYARARAMQPSSAPLLGCYADACIKTGRKKEALEPLRRLLMLDPANVKAAMVFTSAALAVGEPDWASYALPAVLMILANLAAWPSRALGYFSGREFSPEAWFGCDLDGLTRDQSRQVRKARDLLSSRELEGATRLIEELAKSLPDHPAVLELRAFAATRRGNNLEAYRKCEQALASAPESPALRAHLIAAAARAEMFGVAERELAGVPAEHRENGYILDAEAVLLFMSDKPEEALAVLARVEDRPEFQIRVAELSALSLIELGRFDEALAWLEKRERMRPWSSLPVTLAAVIHRLEPDGRLFTLAEQAVDNPDLSQENRATAAFALGEALHASGDHEAAMRRFEQANALIDRIYDAGAEQAFVETQKRLFTPALLGRARDVERGRGIIFICGLPRSGSTLMSRILASHPEVVSIGESQLSSQCFEKAREAGYPDGIANLSDDFYAELGHFYLDSLPHYAKEARFVVDKDLGKFFYLGLMKLILPGARFLQARRDPADVCFSIYRRTFGGLHSYAYRQETIAHFHHLHDEIMAHWFTVMPDDVHEVRYEALVEDPEREARKMFDAAGVPFQPGCLDYRAARGVIRTSSVYQVRQNINRSSIGAWKPYEKHLRVLLEGLAKNPFAGGAAEGAAEGAAQSSAESSAEPR